MSTTTDSRDERSDPEDISILHHVEERFALILDDSLLGGGGGGGQCS